MARYTSWRGSWLMEPKMFFTSLHQTAGILPHPYVFTQVSEQHSCSVQQGSSAAGELTWANTDEELGHHLACLRLGESKLCFSLRLQSCSTKLSPLGYLVLMLLEANSVTEEYFSWTMLIFCLWKSVQLMEIWHRLWFLAISVCPGGFSGKQNC